LFRLSWVVFVHAVLLSAEAIAIEILTTQFNLTPLTIAASSSSVAGALLLSISFMKEKERSLLVFNSWKYLVPGSILVAAGLFTFSDSISTIGASKVGLLSGPLETVIIIFLARVTLHEKLTRIQIIGVLIALSGLIATVMSGFGGVTRGEMVRWGDAEALLSAGLLGIGIIFITKLTCTHSILAVTGSLLLISGLVLTAIVLMTGAPDLTPPTLTILFLFSLLPLAVALSYVAGLARIGASLTSIIASFSILLTLAFQLILLWLNVQVILPANVTLAVTGGVFGVFGMFLVHRNNKKEQ
jgi:probable blue pigment (indigoidine) exporter